eukprot:TRINITY_DN2293_c0_g1_i2.p3 TRINITY_DN2293_c0_g1~~TRINITY_DN2293_c0_g1_i2.p3  ORF type:complete len:59 (-),score=5.09 TRINITY_DN2293_c0_g1_i2:314-490(-)
MFCTRFKTNIDREIIRGKVEDRMRKQIGRFSSKFQNIVSVIQRYICQNIRGILTIDLV